jgi:hypothetical protein
MQNGHPQWPKHYRSRSDEQKHYHKRRNHHKRIHATFFIINLQRWFVNVECPIRPITQMHSSNQQDVSCWLEEKLLRYSRECLLSNTGALQAACLITINEINGSYFQNSMRLENSEILLPIFWAGPEKGMRGIRNQTIRMMSVRILWWNTRD